MSTNLGKTATVSTGVTIRKDTPENDIEDSSIFCETDFLKLLQLSPHRPFDDSKTLVDCTLLKPVSDLRLRLSKIPQGEDVDEETYKELLECYLSVPPEKPESKYTPVDFDEGEIPLFARKFPERLKKFVGFLKDSFKGLYRRSGSCADGGEFDMSRLHVVKGSTLLELPYGYFVPGGRFRECYYWDTYWTILGLLACDMLESAMGAVRNLLYLVNVVGFVPNGNRTYYLGRSQPPMLGEMIEVVYCHLVKMGNESGAKEWLVECTPVLEKEYRWWMENRSIPIVRDGVSKGTLNRYIGGDTPKPRPESFKEDWNDVKSKEALGNILAGCEAGWDFSSRWYSDAVREQVSSSNDRKNKSHDVQGKFATKDILPVCLNSIMLRIETLLCKYHGILGHKDKAEKYKAAICARKKIMWSVMWDDSKNLWHDYNWKKQEHSPVISAACWLPLWAECYGLDSAEWDTKVAKKCVNSLMDQSGIVGIAGVACTPACEGLDEQWDWPNGWPPIQDYIVTGLHRVEKQFGKASGGCTAAQTVSKRWLGGLFKCWERQGVMHEKYDVRKPEGGRGAGGEYEPQIGFGWTNGVALHFMKLFHEEIGEDIAWLDAPETVSAADREPSTG